MVPMFRITYYREEGRRERGKSRGLYVIIFSIGASFPLSIVKKYKKYKPSSTTAIRHPAVSHLSYDAARGLSFILDIYIGLYYYSIG